MAEKPKRSKGFIWLALHFALETPQARVANLIPRATVLGGELMGGDYAEH